MRLTNVIFDIDGTLVDSNGFEGTLYRQAVRATLGAVTLRPDWGDYDHVTDAGIFQQVCRENGIDAAPHTAGFRVAFGELVEAHLRAGHPCAPIPGAGAVLSALAQRPGVAVGIATGGWGHTARMKLAAAGLDIRAYPLTSSDHAVTRVEIMTACHAQLPAADVTVYVGDGPWDRRATESLGWRFVGVGGKLRGRCERWLEDYADPDAAVAILER